MKALKKYISQHTGLIFSLIFVLIIKIPHLSLPFFGDEAWSYYAAILKMAENGPGILPGSIPLDSAKGHPLLFYFLASTWISIFSNQVIIVRLFALIISISTLLSFYFVAKKLTNNSVANLSVAIFSVQSLFLAQSTLILPEMLLTLFLIITFYAFIKKKYILYAIAGSLMILTKETGIIFIGTMGLFFMIENIRKYNVSDFWIKIIWLSVPLAIYAVFLLLHYHEYGFFFYKEHINLIDLENVQIAKKLKSATSILLTRYGRNTMLFLSLISLLILLFRKIKIKKKQILLLSLSIILIFIIFTVFNFYTYRYILPLFPIFILTSVSLIYQSRLKNRFINTLFTLILILTPLYYSATKAGKNDSDLGYVQYIPVYEQVVHFCEDQNWQEKTFSGGFNMVLALREPYTGYLDFKEGFKVYHLDHNINTDILILDSTSKDRDTLKEVLCKYKLYKRFENKNHWGEIYIKTDINNVR